MITADVTGQILQWYLLAENETPENILRDIQRGNEQGKTVNSLETLKNSPIEKKTLNTPVHLISSSSHSIENGCNFTLAFKSFIQY